VLACSVRRLGRDVAPCYARADCERGESSDDADRERAGSQRRWVRGSCSAPTARGDDYRRDVSRGASRAECTNGRHPLLRQ